MPVFISHRTADDRIAREVYERLTKTHGITCYLDDLDKQTATQHITALIVSRLRQCTNLLAIVTENTRGSWWVPFEVGVAREAPRVITSFTSLAQQQLPEFLTEWPVLRGESAVDTFADHYRRGVPQIKRAADLGKFAFSDTVSAVESFHRQLKQSLGQ